ncbi:hypothetical protein [Zavarzinia compransoris]|uniref:Uncharacterized protein n=1 Tax=Zavarzinia compransoris TaxID=1264899 RepID=A0A317E7X6_9PROT|nr:hypothetical protein [Zavarzinia compransoris]PWR23238.1 hypothetical protein DKG75_01300 [Zavarzinia compransoris]TDP46202.1 hypothetical protein DES42_104288 [Zavarzinia compransoris]
MGFDGWSFNQQQQGQGIVCRAIQGPNIMARNTDGKVYVSVPSTGIAKAKYPESTVIVGGSAELVDAESFGDRLLFYIDDTVLEQVAVARGYTWQILAGGRIKSGTVKFNNSAVSALERVMECVSANGG